MLEVPTTHKRHKEPNKVKITRSFACPLRRDHYQASFYLNDTSSDRIRAVSVIGLAEEAKMTDCGEKHVVAITLMKAGAL
jgi:hypothetical protein